jgi:hypothetical protein
MNPNTTPRPGEQVIVVDSDNMVLYSDFDPLKPVEKAHLLDLIDTNQQDVLRLVGVAIDRPGQEIGSPKVRFRGALWNIRAIAEAERTHLFFAPAKS